MKIEMGESLIYSWLRHVKECQLVQTNWKVSKTWDLKNKDKLTTLMQQSGELFLEKYGYDLYGENKLGQLLQQAEIDVLGLAHKDGKNQIYAVDIAFHESGLNYGKSTTARVIKKCLRSAMCIYGYYGFSEATIIFTSPKISLSIVNKIQETIKDMQILLAEIGLNYAIRMITNEDFAEEILKPVRRLKGNVADTSELFMRSIQLDALFDEEGINPKDLVDVDDENDDSGIELKEKKIGELAQIAFRDVLERGLVDSEELEQLQTLEYSKETFRTGFPLLQKERNETNKGRYYAYSIHVAGGEYYLTNDWYETSRPYVLAWLAGLSLK